MIADKKITLRNNNKRVQFLTEDTLQDFNKNVKPKIKT